MDLRGVKIPQPLAPCPACFARINELGKLTENGAMLVIYCRHNRVAAGVLLNCPEPFWTMYTEITQEGAEHIFGKVCGSPRMKRPAKLAS